MLKSTNVLKSVVYLYQQKQIENMRTVIKSTSGKKAVRISYNDFNGYVCCYYEIDELNQRERVIEMKNYSTEKRAVSYANKVLSK